MNKNYMTKPSQNPAPNFYYLLDEEMIGWKFIHRQTGIVYKLQESDEGIFLIDDNGNPFNYYNSWAQRKHEFSMV